MINSIELKKIYQEFLDYFKSNGYYFHDAEPLIPTSDKTLAFTNATIVPLKKFFSKSYKKPGFVIFQPCLRLWNIKNDNFVGNFTSFFRMVSILVHPEVEFINVQNEISNYLKNILKIPEGQIIIHSNKTTNDLVGAWLEKYEIVYNQFDNKFYKWNYGFNNIKGRGVTFFIKTGNKPRELGNFVEIRDKEKVIGYEFGFGVESCAGIINGLENNFDVLFGKDINRKLLDITCARVIIEQALWLADYKINGTTRSSIRKVDSELVYSICEFENGDCSYIRNINWDIFDVELGVVESVINSLEAKIDQIKKDIKLLNDYQEYLNKMIELGKKQDWADRKINEYISKNNYYKIINLINKKTIL